MATINPGTGVPLIAQLVCGVLAAVLAACMDVHELSDILGIGIMAAYSVVCAAVIALRLRDTAALTTTAGTTQERLMPDRSLGGGDSGGGSIQESLRDGGGGEWQRGAPTRDPFLVLLCMLIALASSVGGYAFAAFAASSHGDSTHASSGDSSGSGSPPVQAQHTYAFPRPHSHVVAALLLYGSLAIVLLCLCYLCHRFSPGAGDSAQKGAAILSQPTAVGGARSGSFRCPCTPLIPVLGIVANGYLMGQLPWPAWVRLAGLSGLCLASVAACGGGGGSLPAREALGGVRVVS